MMPTFDFNKIIRILIISDFFVFSAWGLIMPVLAVFIIDIITQIVSEERRIALKLVPIS